MSNVLKTAWFATKVGIGGGVIYLTVDQGIWGSSQQATAAYDRVFDIMPGTKSVSEKYLNLPKKEDVNINFRSYWNTGVFYTFDFVANVPSKVVSLKDYVVDFATSPPAVAKKGDETSKAEESTPVQSEAAVAPEVSAEAAQENPPAEVTQ
ncbi:MICOS complex subunit MIC13 QIL1 [Chionoecetes opilio]|uniref:MICOS complex subunit MIC13 n=1 Tax=Chionoecetes opilio TaxID=41210 RepID=A0A8J4Y3J2_CHIOP|nr:MICOS complex subunit MIC13 QIL1 [Chionoecetes opilio]